MEREWSVGDICKMNTYARRDITVQIRTYMIIGTDVIYIVEETLTPFEKHICFKDADKKTYLDLEEACRCLGLPTTIQIVNSSHCMSFEGASERFFYTDRRPLNAVPIGMSYYIPCCDSDDTTSMRMKELNSAAALAFKGDYIKLEFVLPYNDSIKEYLPNMEERWENYYCVANLEFPL